jgi:hypothetical protein
MVMLLIVGFCKYGLVKNICPTAELAGSNRNSYPNEIIGAPMLSAVAESVFFKKFRLFALIVIPLYAKKLSLLFVLN